MSRRRPQQKNAAPGLPCTHAENSTGHTDACMHTRRMHQDACILHACNKTSPGRAQNTICRLAVALQHQAQRGKTSSTLLPIELWTGAATWLMCSPSPHTHISQQAGSKYTHKGSLGWGRGRDSPKRVHRTRTHSLPQDGAAGRSVLILLFAITLAEAWV